jgi:MFS family permease
MLIRKSLPYALAQFCVIGFQWAAMIFIPLYFKERGVADADIGILVATFDISTLLLVFPLGVLSDRIPPRPLMIAGGLLAAAACALLPWCRDFHEMALGMGAAGAGFTLTSIALAALFFKQVDPDRRGGEVAVFSIGGVMGGGVGAWVCGQLMKSFPVAHVLFPVAIGFALGWALLALTLPGARGLAFPLLEYGKDLKRGATWVLVGIMIVTASHSGFEHSGYTLLQTEVIHLSTAAIGNLFIIIAVWMALITLWTGRRHDQAERPLLMMGLALIVSGAFMAASGSASGAVDFLAYRLLHTLGDAVFILLIMVVAAAIFPKHRVGGAYAFALTVNTASYALFAYIGGVVGQHHGFDQSFHLAGAIEVAGGVVLLVLRPWLRRSFRMEESG